MPDETSDGLEHRDPGAANAGTVTAATAQRYFNSLDAPRGKQLVWFENSAHWPHIQEPEEYREVLVKTVLQESERRQ